MATIVRKGLLGKEDTRFYTAASPTFSRITSTGGAIQLTAVAATHVPLVQAAASRYFSQNTVQRGVTEIVSRYVAPDHSLATYAGGVRPGKHVNVFGYRNATAATSIQAAASNMFLRDGIARIVVPEGTYTVNAPLQLPRRCILIGNGAGSTIRANATTRLSRAVTISGSVGATTSNITVDVYPDAWSCTVANGALFSVNQHVQLQDNHNSEVMQIKSIAGNVLTFHQRSRHGYRAGATTKSVTLVYPARLYLDHVRIRASGNATTGLGIAATYLQNSTFGPNVIIENYGAAGIKFNSHCNLNTVDAEIAEPTSTAGAVSYGVWLADSTSHENQIGGKRRGAFRDTSQGGFDNRIWGVQQLRIPTGTAASGISDPVSYYYRTRKPTLSWTRYSVSGTSTIVVTCPADSNNPAELYINGRVYRNTGTVLCDASRTKTPVSATVGGLERGPLIAATLPYYVYGVPTRFPSATRQFDLVMSVSGPATGPLASATYPAWSFIGAVGAWYFATSRNISPFVQTGDVVRTSRHRTIYSASGLGALVVATYRLSCVGIPTGAESGHFYVTAADVSPSQTIRQPVSVQVRPTDENDAGVSVYGVLEPRAEIKYYDHGNTAVRMSQLSHSSAFVQLNSQKQVRMQIFGSVANATGAMSLYYNGWILARSKYK